MMRSLIAVVALVAVQLAPPPSPRDQVFALFGAYLDALRAQAGIPGLSAAVVGDSDLLWERGFGQQDLSRAIPASADTPFHMDGLTESFTATLVLRCAEDGRLSLDDPIGKYEDGTPDGDATIGQILAHTSPAEAGLVFAYRPERLDPLKSVVRSCTGDSYRETLANLLDRLAMIDSVPGSGRRRAPASSRGRADPGSGRALRWRARPPGSVVRGARARSGCALDSTRTTRSPRTAA